MPKQETFQPILSQSDASPRLFTPPERPNAGQFLEAGVKLGVQAYTAYKEEEYSSGIENELNKYINRKTAEANPLVGIAGSRQQEELLDVIRRTMASSNDQNVRSQALKYLELAEMTRQGAASVDEVTARTSAMTVDAINKYPHLADNFRKAERAVLGDYGGMLSFFAKQEQLASAGSGKKSVQQEMNEAVVKKAISDGQAVFHPGTGEVDFNATLRVAASKQEFAQNMDRLKKAEELGQIDAYDKYVSTAEQLSKMLDVAVTTNANYLIDLMQQAETSGDPNVTASLTEVMAGVNQLTNELSAANDKVYQDALLRVKEDKRAALNSIYEVNKKSITNFKEMFTDTKTGYGSVRAKALSDLQNQYKMNALQAGGVLYSMREMLGDQVMANVINSNLLSADVSRALDLKTKDAVAAALTASGVPAMHHNFMMHQMDILRGYRTLGNMKPGERTNQIASIWNKVEAFSGQNRIIPQDKNSANKVLEYFAQLGGISEWLTADDAARLIDVASTSTFMDTLKDSTKFSPVLGGVTSDEVRRGLIQSYYKVQENVFDSLNSLSEWIERTSPGSRIRLEYNPAMGTYTIGSDRYDMHALAASHPDAKKLMRGLESLDKAANSIVALKDSDTFLTKLEPLQVKEYMARSLGKPIEMAFGESTLDGVNPTMEGQAKDPATLKSAMSEFAARLQEQRRAVETLRTRSQQPSASVTPTNKNEYEQYAEVRSNELGVDPDFVKALIDQESGWDPNAKSPTGPTGLMQLARATASAHGVTNRADPKQSIDGGTSYVKYLMELFGDDPWKLAAAYYMGEGAFNKVKDKPRSKWTSNVPKEQEVLDAAKVHADKVVSLYNKRLKERLSSSKNMDKLEPGVYVDQQTGEMKDLRNPRKLEWGPDGKLVYSNG